MKIKTKAILTPAILKTADINNYKNHDTHMQAVSNMLTNRYSKLDKIMQTEKGKRTMQLLSDAEQLSLEVDYLRGVWQIAYAVYLLAGDMI